MIVVGIQGTLYYLNSEMEEKLYRYSFTNEINHHFFYWQKITRS